MNTHTSLPRNLPPSRHAKTRWLAVGLLVSLLVLAASRVAGYTITIPAGSSYIGDPLLTSPTSLGALFPNTGGELDQDQVRIYDCAGGFICYTFDSTSPTGLADCAGVNPVPAPTINPGQGFLFMNNNGYGAYNWTVGGTPGAPVLPPANYCGCGKLSLLCGQGTNLLGTYQNITGFAPQEGAQEQIWNGVGYTIYTFTAGAWSPSTPAPLSYGRAAFFLVPCVTNPPALTISLPGGTSYIGDPLLAAPTALTNLFPNPAGQLDGNQVLIYNCAGTYTCYQFDSSSPSGLANCTGGAAVASPMISPGQGFVFVNQSGATYDWALYGMSGAPVLPPATYCGCGVFSLLCCQSTNLPGTYQNITGVAPRSGAQEKIWTGSAFITYTYVNGAWSPVAPPDLRAGQSAQFLVPCVTTNTIIIPPGTSYLGDPLLSDPTSLAKLFPNAGGQWDMNQIGIYDCSGFTIYTMDSFRPTGFGDCTDTATMPAPTLYPGEGLVFFNHSGSTLNWAVTGPSFSPVLPPMNYGCCGQFVLLCCQSTMLPGTYQNITGVPPFEGVKETTWNGGSVTNYAFLNGMWNSLSNGVWTPSPAPVVASGEAALFMIPCTNTISILAGQNYIGDPLLNRPTSLTNLFPNPTGQLDGNQVQLYNCSGTYVCYQFDSASPSGLANCASGAPVASPMINPGQGFGFVNQSGATYDWIVTGVLNPPGLPPENYCGDGKFSLLACQNPNLPGTYQNITGFAPREGAQEKIWTGSSFVLYTFTNGAWSPLTPPALASGHAAMFLVPFAIAKPVPSGIRLAPGSHCVSDPFLSGPTLVSAIFPNPGGELDGDLVRLYVGHGNYSCAMFDSSKPTGFGDCAGGAAVPPPLIRPGEGFIFVNNSASDYYWVINGTPGPLILPPPADRGCDQPSLLGCQSGDLPGTYQNITGRAPDAGAQEQIWNGTAFVTYTFDGTKWSPRPPRNLYVGEGAMFVMPCDTNLLTVTVTNTIPTGWSLIGDQIMSGPRALTNLFPNPGGELDGDQVAIYNGLRTVGAYLFDSSMPTGLADFSGLHALPAPTISPGQGFAYNNTGGAARNWVVTGTPGAPLLPPATFAGVGQFSLLCRQYGTPFGTYSNVTGFALLDGAQVVTLVGGNFVTNTYTGGTWLPGPAPLLTNDAAVFFLVPNFVRSGPLTDGKWSFNWPVAGNWQVQWTTNLTLPWTNMTYPHLVVSNGWNNLTVPICPCTTNVFFQLMTNSP